ncbi:MAG TPA: hypothetical protein VHP11_09730, partial [Tepidisphaeraceae bacterium]|nr:hypothetical protein [Tepidisphaeraceae bacterium]
NEKWDSTALAFLDAMTIRFSYDNAYALYWPASFPTYQDTLKLGKTALDAGCDDPVVLYCYASLLDDDDQLEQGLPLLIRATDRLIKSKYPKYRIASACNRVLRRLDPERQQAERTRYWNELWKAGLSCMEGDFINQDRRVIWENIRPQLTGSSAEHNQALYEAVKKLDKPDPWLVQMIGGNYHISAAWSARGSGSANAVTDEGWQGFYGHLKEARKCLRKAYELQPTYPEAAWRMISVAMGGGDTLGENPRDWFDKAVAAEFDYLPAYSAMLWALRPRWGGSHEEMYRFGVECLQTGRFDTMVPYQLLTSLNNINSECNYDHAVFSKPGVFENVAQLLTKYAETDKTEANAHRSCHVALAWKLGRFKEAKEVLDRLKNNIVPDEFSGFTAFVELPVSQIHAMTGPNAAQLQAAEKLAAQGQFQQASEKYQAIAATLAKDARESLYVRSRGAELRWRKDLAKGEWTSILPTSDLEGWYATDDQWRIDDRSGLVGSSDGADMMLACLADFGPRFELQLDIDSTGQAQSQPYVGAMVAYAGPSRYYSVLWDRATSKLIVHPSGGDIDEFDVPSGTGSVLLIRVFDGHMNVTVNGNTVVRDYEVDPRLFRRDSHICVGASSNEPRFTVRFNSVKVRLLRR